MHAAVAVLCWIRYEGRSVSHETGEFYLVSLWTSLFLPTLSPSSPISSFQCRDRRRLSASGPRGQRGIQNDLICENSDPNPGRLVDKLPGTLWWHHHGGNSARPLFFAAWVAGFRGSAGERRHGRRGIKNMIYTRKPLCVCVWPSTGK